MLPYRRVTRVPLLDAVREAHFLLHSGLRAYVVRSRGVTTEKRLMLGARVPQTPGTRRAVQVVLAGRMCVSHAGREVWLEAGDVSLQPEGFADERWEGEVFEVVVLEWSSPWNDGPVTEWATGRLGARDRARVASWATRAVGADLCPSLAAEHVAGLIELLRALGIPVLGAEAGDLVEAVPDAARCVASALGKSLSDLEERPMWVDLEAAVGRSARHLRRHLLAFNLYYGFPGGLSWKRMLRWWRLSMATTLMTARGATTENVAAALGYGSPQSFCLAMAQAGLPSPGRIARVVQLAR